ncbi:UNVERIFIED_CONTAM: protein SEMI-ROLLED LEAF 2 [Sesamum angustifolium]|uniref:Protein SEMI-ROLLED LEAF 2 n=1 Tax=Sesamum angustifolium TaxID=2727405 RepID=A0AAW2PVK6_9LAMI
MLLLNIRTRAFCICVRWMRSQPYGVIKKDFLYTLSSIILWRADDSCIIFPDLLNSRTFGALLLYRKKNQMTGRLENYVNMLQKILCGFQREDSKNPCFWSRVCLHNMAKLGKEATTMRRVLESLFRYFDNGNLWPAKDGIAFPVLKDMQLLMDDSGQNTHFLLSILVKHLDHKNVLKQPDMQLDIVQVVTALARLAKIHPSVAIVSAVSDVMRHLRKGIHCSLDDANLGEDLIKWNRKYHEAVDECLVELSSKVDPFLSLVEDSKFQINDLGSVHQTISYGSKDDDSSALRCLSELKLNEDQTTDALVSVIIKNMENLSDSEESTTREQLLKEFVPDDLCSIKSPLFADSLQDGHKTDSYDNKSLDKITSIFVMDDDPISDSVEASKHNSQSSIGNPSLLSVDQLLQSVLESAHHVGRMSVSHAPDASYKETADHCEALLMGKQKKMSYLISNNQRQGNSLTSSPQNPGEEDKQMVLHEGSFNKAGNLFLDLNVPELPIRPFNGPSALCAIELQHHTNSSFKLPASSPYDNFLKAAGC